MLNRYSHAGKSTFQREAYKSYLKRMDYEPTLDDFLAFPDTEKPGEDFSESTIKRKRPVSWKYSLSEHWNENWVKYLLGGLLIFGLYLINESRIKFSVYEVHLNNIDDSISKIDKTISDINKRLLDQEKDMVKNNVRIDYIERNNSK